MCRTLPRVQRLASAQNALLRLAKMALRFKSVHMYDVVILDCFHINQIYLVYVENLFCFNPSNAEPTFVQSTKTQRFLKNI